MGNSYRNKSIAGQILCRGYHIIRLRLASARGI